MSELTRQDVQEIVDEATQEIGSDINNLKSQISSLGVEFETFQSDVKAIRELVTPYAQTQSQIKVLSERVDRTESDIFVLKHAIKHANTPEGE